MPAHIEIANSNLGSVRQVRLANFGKGSRKCGTGGPVVPMGRGEALPHYSMKQPFPQLFLPVFVHLPQQPTCNMLRS